MSTAPRTLAAPPLTRALMTRALMTRVLMTSVLLAGLVMNGPLAGAPATAQPAGNVIRIGGDTPLATAIDVSRTRFPDDGTAQRVVLVTDADFADALTGAILTGGDAADAAPAGPLLLTPRGALDAGVAAEITRVLPAGGEVIVLGGEAAVAEAVIADLQARGFAPRRIFGPSRFETAVAVAEERLGAGQVDTVQLARGDAPAGNPTAAWADAVSGSTAASAPILLTPQSSLHPAARTFIDDVLGPRAAQGTDAQVLLLGGEAALSTAVEQAVPDAVTTGRLAGPTRDGTAVAIAEAFGQAADTAVVYDGFSEDGWAFGLPAATLARDVDAALLPVSTAAVAQATARYVGCAAVAVDLIVIGSTAVVPQSAVDAHQRCPDAAPASVVLDGGGLLPGAQVGQPLQPAVDAVAAVLGQPTDDTGVVEGCPFDSDQANERYVTFGDLTLSGYLVEGQMTFASWSYRLPSAMGLVTERGLGSGATNADVGTAYPEATLIDDTLFGPHWDVPASADGPMLFFTEGTGPSDALTTMYGGDVLFCE